MRIAVLEEQVQSLQNDVKKKNEETEEMRTELESMIADLKKKADICMERKESLTKILLPGVVTFGFGSAKLTRAGREVIDKIWEVLTKYPDHHILIEGHTDDVPIDEQYRHIFRSNWELSTARANAVLHYLLDKHKADPKRIAAVGFGEYAPVADNEIPGGRAKNRRVVIAVRDKM
jgi:chemotaxis protein MotB